MRNLVILIILLLVTGLAVFMNLSRREGVELIETHGIVVDKTIDSFYDPQIGRTRQLHLLIVNIEGTQDFVEIMADSESFQRVPTGANVPVLVQDRGWLPSIYAIDYSQILEDY